MTYLGLERPVAWETKSLVDPTTILMYLNSLRDYINALYNDYKQANLDMKEFNKEYGDFISPFRKDMARYGEIIGGIKDKINQAYANGIDPLRSPEGRAMITRLISSIDPAEFNMMRSNAKTGYAYLDALQALRKAGKFSQDQEDFDIALNGETSFDDFSTSGPGGALNTWGRTSPIQATTLTDLARPHYEHRTPRVLTKADFDSDPRLKNYKWDPRYEWTGYLDSDLMKVAPGASSSLKGDPRAAFFRELSKLKALAANPNATEADIEAQWLRDIADASAWALVDPTRKADDFAKMATQFSYSSRLQNQEHKNKMDEIAAANAGKTDTNISGGYQHVVSDAAAAQRDGFKIQAIADYIGNNKHRQNEALRIANIMKKDSKDLTAEDKKLINTFGGKIMGSFMNSKTSSGRKVVNEILNLQEGDKGVAQLNNILSTRIVKGHWKDDHDYVMSYNNYEADSDGWYKNRGDGGKILTPHQLMKNILKYESGSGFSLKRRNGTSVTQNDLIKHLDDVQNSDDLWINATPKERADRTDKIKSMGQYLVAPNEAGVPTVYMMVRLGKQSGFFHLPQGEHDGYWMETNLSQLPNGTLSNESTPSTYASETWERKTKSNASVTQSYTDN